jgi:hypothetical protein
MIRYEPIYVHTTLCTEIYTNNKLTYIENNIIIILIYIHTYMQQLDRKM